MPNRNGSSSDVELEADQPSDEIYRRSHDDSSREQDARDFDRPAPPPIEELLMAIIERLDTLIELTKRNRGESSPPGSFRK
jgi:hypothetical protein